MDFLQDAPWWVAMVPLLLVAGMAFYGGWQEDLIRERGGGPLALVTTWMGMVVMRRRELGEVSEARVTEVEDNQSDVGRSYRVDLITSRGRVPVTPFASSSRRRYEGEAEALNAFLASDQPGVQSARAPSVPAVGIGAVVFLVGLLLTAGAVVLTQVIAPRVM